MQSINISLPEPLQRFVDGRVAQGGYGSASEYIRALIQTDEKARAEEELAAKLLAGMHSHASELGPEEWIGLRKEALVGSRRAER